MLAYRCNELTLRTAATMFLVSLLFACSSDSGGGGDSPTAPTNFSISAAGVTAVFHGEVVTLTATGCPSTVQWSADGADPSTGSGNTFEPKWWPSYGEQTGTVDATCGGDQRSMDIDVLYKVAVCGASGVSSYCSARVEVDNFRNGYDEKIAVTFRSFVRDRDGTVRVLGIEPRSASHRLGGQGHGAVLVENHDLDKHDCVIGGIGRYTVAFDSPTVEATGIVFSFYRSSESGRIDFGAKVRPDDFVDAPHTIIGCVD